MAKIAISLPEETLKAVEKERLASGVSRSEFFRRAAKTLLKQKQREERDREYIRAYQEMPETDDEFEGLRSASMAALAELPWDESDAS